MKKFTIIILLLFLANPTSHAQKEYSMENLEKASQEELDVYLNKSLKLQKSGKTVTIVGGSILGATAVTIGSMAIILHDEDWALGGAVIGFFGGLAGLGTMTTGIIMKSSGKKRVGRINTINRTTSYDTKIELGPCVNYNLATQNYQPGITLRIRF